MPFKPLEGPIPGENFTSDTKNYPWHRPPDVTDLDQAIELSFKKLMSKDTSVSVLTMLEMGVNIATVTDIFVTGGISKGKWTPDFALLLAGPVAHIIYLMAKGYGLEPNLGVDNNFTAPTKSFFDKMKKIDESKAKSAVEGIDLETIQGAAAGQEPPAEESEQPAGPPKTGMMAGGLV